MSAKRIALYLGIGVACLTVGGTLIRYGVGHSRASDAQAGVAALEPRVRMLEQSDAGRVEQVRALRDDVTEMKSDIKTILQRLPMRKQ